MNSFEASLNKKILEKQAAKQLRVVKPTERAGATEITRNGKKLISFACNDYLGLLQDSRLKKAAIDAIEKYGTGAGASRLITGNNPLYDQLEQKLAELFDTEAACVFSSGYTANMGAISTLNGSADLIITDKLAHSCIIEGAKLSGASFKRFIHNDINSLERILEKNRDEHENCMVITEAVFSMDGDSADIVKLSALCKKYNATLYIDHAHDLKHSPANAIHMGTMSKAFGSLGGFVAGSKTVVGFLKTSCKPLINSTALPPATLAASLKALEIISQEKFRITRALDNAKYFKQIVSSQLPEAKLGNSNSQIIPLILGSEELAIKLSEHLAENGFLVHAIRPPTVPANTSRLRFSFSSAHNKAQIEQVAELTINYLKNDRKI